MADTLTINVRDIRYSDTVHVRIPVIGQTNPCFGYDATEDQIRQLMSIPNYEIRDAATGVIINGHNLQEYFPGGGGGEVTSYSSLTGKPAIDNHTLMSGNNASSDLGLQTKLTTAQLAAVNSGITDSDVTQIQTNKNNISLKANTSDVNTATTNLQNQINQIEISASAEAVVAPEVAAARVGIDGTSYQTLKARLDNTDNKVAKSLNYKGNIESPESIDSTSLEIGEYYASTATSCGTFPTASDVYLLTVIGKSPYFYQSVISLVNGKQYVRCYNNGWKSWKETTVTSFPYYKRTLTGEDNINNITSEGVYFFQKIYKPSGDFPDIDPQFALLEVKGAGTNYITQSIIALTGSGNPDAKYTRTKTTAWSEWRSEWTDDDHIKNDIVDTELTAITGYEKVNLLNNTLSTTTSNGVTFTVNADKTINVNGTATGNAFVGMNITLPAGEYFLTGAPVGSSTATYHLICSPNGPSIYDVGNGGSISLAEQKTFAIYVRVMAGKTANNVTFKPMVQKKPVSNPTYIPYGEFQVYKPIQKLIDYTVFNWSGKKINVIGDSIVQGSYGNFVNVIGQILNLSTVRNYGVGGSCLASSSIDQQYPPAVTRYVDMDDDADIVLVHAGTNDYSGQIPLGDEDSTDVTTFNGALNVMMNGLREKYPTALIIFDSILHRYNDGALTIKTREYRQAIENRCLANHIVFYDCYKYSGFDFVKGYYDHILTVDGLHPNQAGANILGRKIAGFIRWN